MQKLSLIGMAFLFNLIFFAHSDSQPYGIQFADNVLQEISATFTASLALHFYEDIAITNDNFTIVASNELEETSNFTILAGVHQNAEVAPATLTIS
jgi:hypothetical protein